MQSRRRFWYAAVLSLPICVALVSPSAADKCYVIGQQVASENRGTLAKVFEEQREGKLMCVVVVLVPGKKGERPRRQEFLMPHI